MDKPRNPLLTTWAEALRSGDYKQGTDTLFNRDNNTYCCLGVLCNVGIPKYSPSYQSMPTSTEWKNLGIIPGSCFSNVVGPNGYLLGFHELNDTWDLTFEEIADIVDELEDFLPVFVFGSAYVVSSIMPRKDLF